MSGSGWGLIGGEDLRRVSLELRRMGTEGGELRKRMRSSIRASAAPMVPAVRASIAAIPAPSEYHSGLRRRLQRATKLRVKLAGPNASVRILVDPKLMPDGEKSIPQLMEGVRKWRHPVFQAGTRDVWVTQTPHPYFFKVVQPLGVKSRIEMAVMVRETSREVL